MTKIIAFYLPQFHEISENNKWWGKGFTEWTNVKKSASLFEKHNQPRVPLNDKYYNILDSSTQEWQSELAIEYGLGGFCYYHYWFNGKKLLEKPAEQMLQNKNISLPFCFSWANEPWTRTWDGKNSEILMHQEYGEMDDWDVHFDYLLPFFKDERYIKVNNKPLFIIYRLSSIKKYEKMLEHWNERSYREGFDGVHILSMLTSFDNKESKSEKIAGFVEFEPMYTIKHSLPLLTQGSRFFKKKILRKFKEHKYLDTLNYNTVWKKITERNTSMIEGKKVFHGAFVGWDNSPRKGNNALIINDSRPKEFQENLGKQIKKSLDNQNEFLFINAWNEWAEGTYLEPDNNSKYSYLEAIKDELLKHKIYPRNMQD